jgi:uncharacterized membrane protein YbaN (DUF454 family)
MTRLIKSLWLIGGTVGLGLGIAGVFLPILPTTPFLLLAAFCYGRGSRRFYDRLVGRSPLGGYIRHYREGRGIPLSQKLWTLVFLWLTIGFSIAFVVEAWLLRTLLLVVAVGVTVHLGRIRTWQPESPRSVDRMIPVESADEVSPISGELG